MIVLTKGDRVEICYVGRTVDGVVLLASPNSQSLMLGFEAILGGYVGMMPVLYEDGKFRDLINDQLVQITKL